MAGIDNRKDVLILLLGVPGITGAPYEPIVGRTRLMKLVFLLDKERGIRNHLPLRDYYTFEPYHYGPFSKDVFDDIDFLRNVGILASEPEGPASHALRDETKKLLEDEDAPEESGLYTGDLEERFELTEKGRRFLEERLAPSLPPDVREILISLKSELGSVSLSSLLRYVYQKYPDSAKKSKLSYVSS